MENWNNFVKFLEEVKVGALATADGDKPQVRAMVFVSLDEEGVIYTTTSCKSNKIIQLNGNSNVSFFIWKERSFFRGEGQAEISKDLGTKKKILEKNPRWKKYYGGIEDPDFCLIKIKISKLEYKE